MRALKIFLLLIAAGLIYGSFSFVSEAYLGSGPAIEPITIKIEAGMTPDQVIALLAEKKIIRSASRYRLFGNFERSVGRPKVGDYLLRPGTSYMEIARQIALGPARREVQLTIIEGWKIDDLIEYLEKEQGILPKDTAASIGRSVNRASFDNAWRSKFSFLRSLGNERSLEGYLFPDTYRVWADQLPDALIEKQLQEFAEKTADLKLGAASAPLRNFDEAVILASIVEREVRKPEDMRIVAGIFLNRLKLGMRLQTDATVSYITGSGRSRSTTQDLAIDSPYNSYKYEGLPPSPVGNPGRTALEAVFNPKTTNYYYFLTDKDGKVFYARNFDEHQANRVKAGF